MYIITESFLIKNEDMEKGIKIRKKSIVNRNPVQN